MTTKKKPELYKILSSKIENISVYLVQCYQDEIETISNIAIDPNTISKQQENTWRNQLEAIYSQIELTLNTQIDKITSSESNNSSNHIEFEALLIEINDYVMKDILSNRINKISFQEILNEAKKSNEGNPVPYITVIPHSILLIVDEVEKYVVNKVQNFATEFIEQLKNEIRQDKIYSKLGENLGIKIREEICKFLDNQKRNLQVAISVNINVICNECRKEHPNLLEKLKDIDFQDMFAGEVNEDEIHNLLKAQFQHKFENIFKIDQSSKVRELLSSTFVTLMRIKNGKLGKDQHAVDFKKELKLEDIIENKLDIDISQEINNRKQQKEARQETVNNKIETYLTIKEEIEIVFNLLQSPCQLPKINKIISDASVS